MPFFTRPSASAEVIHIPALPAALTIEARPSALLAHLTGEFADEIASVWPQPHAPFLLADAGRRHLAFIALAALADADVRPGPGFIAAALQGSLKRAIPAVLPGAPEGLGRALGRLGETAWSGEDYRLLLARLADPGAAKVLRHVEAISAGQVRMLSALPEPLLRRGGALVRLTEDQGRLVARCLAGIAQRDGALRAEQACRTWSGAASPKALFDQITRDIEITRHTPFHPGTARLKPITTREALHDAARRYDNCLGDQMLGLNSHYYEWAGPPGVMLEIIPDPLWGWILDQGRLAKNVAVPADLQAEIAADLETMGVYCGRGCWYLRDCLEDAHKDSFRFRDEAGQRAWAFGG